MSHIDIDADIAARQTQIDELEQQLRDIFEGECSLALEEYHRLADKIARTKQFIQELEADAS